MEEEILLEYAKCEKCKWYYTAKTDDGRFYMCNNEETKPYIKEIKPQFGCTFFEKREII